MNPSLPTAFLLLLLCLPLVSCGRSPSSLQGDRENRFGREQHPQPGLTVRKPKENSGKPSSVLDVSKDVDQLRNSRSLGPGKSQGIRRWDMVFQTQPPRWTYVPRLKSGEGGGGATESNRWTLYRTPSLVMCRLFVCLSSQSTLAIYSFLDSCIHF